MRHHVLTACKIAPTVKNGNAGMELLYEHTLQQRMSAFETNSQQQIEELKAQNAEMLTLMRQMSVGGSALAPYAGPVVANQANMTVGDVAMYTGPVIANQANSNTTQAAGEVGLIQCNVTNMDVNKSITFNTFGKESLAHANSDRIRVILDESLRDTSSIQAAALMAVTKTAMLIYSDPDHPENLTCYMPNKKTNDVLAHTERGWEIFPASVVINQIGQKTIDHIFDRQPHENANHYTLIMKELQQNEQAYIIDSIFRPVLIRNRCLLEVKTDVLPKSGTP